MACPDRNICRDWPREHHTPYLAESRNSSLAGGASANRT
ncbi:hypothetical protein RCH22_003443 [Cryobacterium psychrotolerans]|nr:hypothetical protein [Cryobacterium psychrotolerans]